MWYEINYDMSLSTDKLFHFEDMAVIRIDLIYNAY